LATQTAAFPLSAQRGHIPISTWKQQPCKDECLPEETNRRIVDIISDVNLHIPSMPAAILRLRLPKERTYVTGSPMAEVLHANLDRLRLPDIHNKLGLEKGKYILLSAHREENIDTEKNFTSLFTAIMRWLLNTYAILYSAIRAPKNDLSSRDSSLMKELFSMSRSALMIQCLQ
jgi:UDP-N-acetylglucosamine 2-epimerase (non-hydrolysing)